VRNVDAGSFAVVLKRERLAAGLTQEALAERATLSARAISDLERGVKQTPHQQTIERLAAALGLSNARRNALAAAARPRRDRSFVDELPSGLLTHSVSLVGRERELETLTQLMELVRAGQGAVALLAGEPGIGKTRLLHELAHRARSRGWQVLLGRAYEPTGLPPYLPIVEPLRAYLRACGDHERRSWRTERTGADSRRGRH
jgi:transcriptional regulator with XRE-family HTH domain